MLELGGGLTGRINANVSVFANVDYEFAVGSGDDKRNGVRGAFGARIRGDAPVRGFGLTRLPTYREAIGRFRERSKFRISRCPLRRIRTPHQP